MKKYYLNNVSTESLTITLTKVRTIKPQSSLSLNNKDVEIIKKLKAARKGKPSKLDNLRLSTIKIEDDANYEEDAAKIIQKEAEKQRKAQKELEKKAKAEAEKAQKEAEQNAKNDEGVVPEEIPEEEAAKLLAKKREEVAELLKAEAAKEGKDFDSESLQKAIDLYIEEEAKNAEADLEQFV